VGYDPTYKAVIVGHEGTNFNKTSVLAISLLYLSVHTDVLCTGCKSWKISSSFRCRSTPFSSRGSSSRSRRTRAFSSRTHCALSSFVVRSVHHSETGCRTARAVLKAVRKTMSLYGSTSVITVGHSLGAALSLLDAVYLPLHLPKTTAFRSYLYGLPRVRLLLLSERPKR
jgi:hypothetical protein